MHSTTMQFCALASRGVVRVAGADAASLLQGLITLDVRKLQAAKGNSPLTAQAGVFLNPKGRILHDCLVTRQDETTYELETDAGSCEALADMLARYRLRKKAVIEHVVDRRVFAVMGSSSPALLSGAGVATWFRDPRPGERLGFRVWANGGALPPALAEAREVDEAVYHQVRIASGVVEGDAECKDELPFVLNMDWWPGTLALDKGCYTGQELVARTHYKGEVRKRVVPVLLNWRRGGGNGKPNSLLPPFCSWALGEDALCGEEEGTLGKGGATVSPLDEDKSIVGEGTLLALAPGGLNVGLAVLRHAQGIVTPVPTGGAFPGTHKIDLENGRHVLVCPIRPEWWAAPAGSSNTA